MKKEIATILENLPQSPGCYQMLDHEQKILYIGKAKNLKKRVSQYFERVQNQRIARMVSLVDNIQIILTKTEKEALLLELNLIHQHLPPFNVLLKDDKQYPYIAIKNGQYPYLVLKRSDTQKGFQYYGPYTSSKAAWDTINLLNRVFQLRKCQRLPRRACIYFHLGQCLAPCVNDINDTQIDKIMTDVHNFLLGDNQHYIDDLSERATQAIIDRNSKMALDYIDLVEAINHINVDQKVQNSDHQDRDVINYAVLNEAISISILIVRQGKLLGKQKISSLLSNDDYEEEMISLLMQYYRTHLPPKKILISLSKENQMLLSETLNVEVTIKAHNQMTKSLLEIAKKNAEQDLSDYLQSAHLNQNSLIRLEELQALLGLEKLPLHIDLFDNSHMQGKAAIGAAITYLNGEPYKPLYRHYNLKYGGDDFANMMEVIERRIKRYLQDKKELPDLILVDGGMIQVNAASLVIDNMGVNLKVVGLYKNDKHQTSGLIDSEGEIFSFKNNQELFFFLTRMQDEVHRYAIKGHHQKHQTLSEKSIFADIQGLGPQREKALFRVFKTIKDIRQASLEEIAAVVPLDVARRIKERLEQ